MTMTMIMITTIENLIMIMTTIILIITMDYDCNRNWTQVSLEDLGLAFLNMIKVKKS